MAVEILRTPRSSDRRIKRRWTGFRFLGLSRTFDFGISGDSVRIVGEGWVLVEQEYFGTWWNTRRITRERDGKQLFPVEAPDVE